MFGSGQTVQQSEIAALYNEVIVSDDYCEAVKLFASRLSKQAEKTRAEVFSPKFQGIDMTPLNDSELRLAKYALLRFRNMLIAKELPTEDVNALLLKLYK